MPLILIDELYKNFGDLQVLKGVSFSVEEGQVVAIIGRSGSGKSTLLRVLNGLETFDEGLVAIDGKRLSGLKSDLIPLRLKVGMVFQQFNLFPHLTDTPRTLSVRLGQLQRGQHRVILPFRLLSPGHPSWPAQLPLIFLPTTCHH